MNQAKHNKADAFDDLLGQLVDELALSRETAQSTEQDPAALFGYAPPPEPEPEPEPMLEAPEFAAPQGGNSKALMYGIFGLGAFMLLIAAVVGYFVVMAVNQRPEPPPAVAQQPQFQPGMAAGQPTGVGHPALPGNQVQPSVPGVPAPGTAPAPGSPPGANAAGSAATPAASTQSPGTAAPAGTSTKAESPEKKAEEKKSTKKSTKKRRRRRPKSRPSSSKSSKPKKPRDSFDDL